MIERIKKYFKRRILSNNLKNAPLKKLNIGSGSDGDKEEYKGWISVDKEFLDITQEKDWLDFTPGYNSLDNILAEHVWEHLSDEDTRLANLNCYKFLKKGGRLRIAVPDGFHESHEYIDNVRPGGNGPGCEDHKILYNYNIMVERLNSAGFEIINLLEYWDESKTFNHVEWNIKDGFVKRSLHFDKRNKNGKLGYTSLVVDAIK